MSFDFFSGDDKHSTPAGPANQGPGGAAKPSGGSSWLSSFLDGFSPNSGGAAAPPNAAGGKGTFSSIPEASSKALFGHWGDSFTNLFGFGSSDQKSDKPAEPPKEDPQKAAEDAKKAEERKLREELERRNQKRDSYASQARQDADKEYKEAKDEYDRKPEYEKNGTPVPVKKGTDEVNKIAQAKMVGSEYVTDPKNIEPQDPNAKVGNLANTDEKLKFLKTFRQQDADDPTKKDNENYCGPTTIIAAAICADGAKGLSPLIVQMQKDSANTFKGDKKKMEQFKASMKDIQTRIDKNELTNEDMDVLKEQLYNTMHSKQVSDKQLGKWDRENASIHEKTMQDYLKVTKLDKRMAETNISIKNIDNDGDLKSNHYVLRMKEGVYDPYARKDGQLVTLADQVRDYDGTEQADLRY